MTKTKKDLKVKALKYAKYLIRRKHGWVKGRYVRDVRTPDGKIIEAVCLSEACQRGARRVLKEDNVYVLLDFQNELTCILKDCIPKDGGYRQSVVGFNDNASTEKKDVLAVLDCAIEKASK